MAEKLPEVDSQEKAMLVCPYYRLGEKCAYGCWAEPMCSVDEPLTGWKWRGKDGRFEKMPPEETLKRLARQMMKPPTEGLL